MRNVDLIIEIVEDLTRRPTMAVLAGISIAWGVFMLIVLLGLSYGFRDGMLSLFDDFSTNMTYIYCRENSNTLNREVDTSPTFLKEEDLECLRKSVPEIQYLSPELKSMQIVHSDKQSGAYTVCGVYPEYFNIKKLKVSDGRLLNILDTKRFSKVALIGENVADVMFKGEPVLGNNIRIHDELYSVVGIIMNSAMNPFEGQTIYIPFSSYSAVESVEGGFPTVIYSASSEADPQKLNKRVQKVLSKNHGFAPGDEDSFYFNNMEEQLDAFKKLFGNINVFLWVIGCCTLLGGMFGIGNMMYTMVKERTFEIGIRMAVGATNADIKNMFLIEAILLTILSGTFGLIIGYGGLGIISKVFENNPDMVIKPRLDITATIAIVLILAFAGVFSGIKPAILASSLSPIQALRENQ